MKTCSKCNTPKELDQFNKHKQTIDGYYTICKSCKKIVDKIYYEKNKLKLIVKNKEWTLNNKERRKELDKQWVLNNKEKVKKANKKYRLNNPHYKIRNLWHNLKKNNFNNIDIKEKHEYVSIKEHIEKQFKSKMTWDNIEIDHKIPITWFEDYTPCKIINNLENLQPLFKTTEIAEQNGYIDEIGNRDKRNNFCSPISIYYYNEVIFYIKEKFKKLIKISDPTEERIDTIISQIN